MYKIPVIIFAGGKSSRMGEDKSQLAFSGYASLSEFQYRRLDTLFETVYISAKTDKFDFECSVIEDNYEVHSPLAGLVSIFENIDAEEIFVLSVDAPFVDRSVIDRLFKEDRDELDAIIAQSPNGLEPLCAIYKNTILPKAKEMLEHGDHRLTLLIDSVKSKKVKFDSSEPFLNLNHPEEYKEALRRLL